MKRAPLVVLVGLLAAAGPARAGESRSAVEAPARAEAAERFDRGMARLAEGDHAGALDHLNHAHQLSPSAEVLFNIGLLHAQLGQSAEAVRALDRLLADPGTLPAAVLDRARQVRDREAQRAEPLAPAPVPAFTAPATPEPKLQLQLAAISVQAPPPRPKSPASWGWVAAAAGGVLAVAAGALWLVNRPALADARAEITRLRPMFDAGGACHVSNDRPVLAACREQLGAADARFNRHRTRQNLAAAGASLGLVGVTAGGLHLALGGRF